MGAGRGALKGNCVLRGSCGAGLSQVPAGTPPGYQVHSSLVSPSRGQESLLRRVRISELSLQRLRQVPSHRKSPSAKKMSGLLRRGYCAYPEAHFHPLKH